MVTAALESTKLKRKKTKFGAIKLVNEKLARCVIIAKLLVRYFGSTATLCFNGYFD